MSEETLNEAIQKTNFHSLFKQLMADAEHHEHREFNFVVDDPESRWIIQVKKKYKNLFQLAVDKLDLTSKEYVWADHTLSIDWMQDEDDDYKWKLSFNFGRSNNYPNTYDNYVHFSPSHRFDCDIFFKDLRKTLFWENWE
ncbi:hypothetical protein N9K19_01225 [Gammaproteobacteria bacterium]|nr:hypothetical protein [Gammaproteobacteria bacterium]